MSLKLPDLANLLVFIRLLNGRRSACGTPELLKSVALASDAVPE